MRNIQISVAITNKESQSITSYFTDISKLGMISAGEEIRLAQLIKAGDKAAQDRLVQANLRFVVSIAKKYQNQGLPLIDLINEGNIGLIKAAGRFDETKGFKFISFAVWWIRQSNMAAIIENARMVRLPMNKINEITKINKAITALEQQTLRDPTPEQLSGYMEMQLDKVNDALYYAPWTQSYDQTSGEEDFSLLDKIPAPGITPDQELMDKDISQILGQLLSSLSERDRKIMEMSYGIGCDWEMSPADIARRLGGITQERVRQIRNTSLEKLQFAIAYKRKYRGLKSHSF